MSALIIGGDTSGAITLSAPTVAGSNTITLPANSGIVALTSDIAGGYTPAGTIIQYAGTTAPTGYLLCPLSATTVSRTTYAALFAAIGTTWGVGDGSTTFGIPYFAAGLTGVQANSNVGTNTVGQVISHTHTTNATYQTSVGGAGYYYLQAQAATATIYPTGGANNLAAGNYVLFCVKY
jgi:hypothetical protein